MTAGQELTIRQGEHAVQTTVQTVAPPDENDDCKITAELPRESAGAFSTDAPVQAEITFSRNTYSAVLPASAGIASERG